MYDDWSSRMRKSKCVYHFDNLFFLLVFQSTLCHALQEIGDANNRNFKVINLDPAAEIFKYRCAIDIRDIIALDDV